MDDIILTTSSTSALHQIVHFLSAEFAMKDLGPLHHFLGISVTRTADGLHLSQRSYIEDLLSRAGMSSCNPVSTLIDTKSKLSADVGIPLKDPTFYLNLAGALQYLTITRPDIMTVHRL